MNFKKILITTGDVDGIGLEVTAKSLIKLGPQKNVIFFLFRSESEQLKAQAGWLRKIDRKFERVVVDNLEQGFDFFDQMKRAKDLSAHVLIDIASDLSPAHWVEQAAQACYDKQASGMATGPLSKGSIHMSGLNDMGHTDILKRISNASAVHMGFVGKYFSIVIATGHIPVNKISSQLNFKSLGEALLNANSLRVQLPPHLKNKPIAVLGLNPHAGEAGLIGTEELSLFPNLRQFATEQKIPMSGPLVPDVAFLKQNWTRYSVFLALYHDQGLTPFKTIHGQDSGVHITLGIPFVRTSVDHGTAKDIFGKNKANHRSMTEAIQWALKQS